MACRNVELAERVAEEIRGRHPGAAVIVGPRLDLTSQASVAAFAAEYRAKKWPLHVLVNNAGMLYEGEPWMVDGIAGPAQVNYLGPFTLTRLLEAELIASAPSRVVNVSSVTHRMACLGDPDTYLTNWSQGRHYGLSKLVNALFAFEFERRLRAAGLDNVHSCAVDPGGVKSQIWQGSGVFSRPPVSTVINALYAPNEDGALPVVHAATVVWGADAPGAAAVNAARGAGGEGDGARFYARGAFGWPGVTSLRGEVHRKRDWTLGERVRATAFNVSALVHSSLDWPLRWATGGRLAGATVPVRAAPAAYDETVAARLWEVSCEAAGVPSAVSVAAAAGGGGIKAKK